MHSNESKNRISATPTKIETKVTAATLGSFAAGVGVAILNAAVGNSELMGGLPGWLQFLLIVGAPSAITFLSGYAKSSATSRSSDGYVPPAVQPSPPTA